MWPEFLSEGQAMAASVGVRAGRGYFKAWAHASSVPSSVMEKTSLRPVPGGLLLTLAPID